MGFIDNAIKALRLLGGRRYTNDSLGTAQEAFTRTIDIGGLDVFTQDGLVPTQNLPFSGSSSQGQYYQVEGNNILRYWFRQRLTKSNTSTETWFFMSPIGATNGVTPQLIQPGQQADFISPKYSVSSLANANTEDSTPGYGVKVFKSTSTNSGSFGNSEVVSINDYQFDYKTGVLQFDQNAPNSNQIVYMTAYQYVGNTLATGVEVAGTGSFQRVEVSGDVNVEGNITAQQLIVSSSVTNMVIATRSGSTSFGDSTDDIHQFTGSLKVSGSILPSKDNQDDLGSSTKEFKDLFIDGTANIDTLSLTDDFTYGGVTFNEDSSMLSITVSSFRLKATDGSDLFTLYNSSDELTFQVDDKVVVLGARTTTPTAVAGGLFYSGSDQWFLGYENSTPPS